MKKLLFISAAICAVVACNKESRAFLVDDDVIRYDAVRYVNTTKADVISSALDTTVRFGVSSTLNYDGGAYVYFNNQEVAYDGYQWSGINELKWPKGPEGYSLDFQAYAPYSSIPWCKVDDGKLVSDGEISVATIDTTAANYNLMYSDRVLGATGTGSSVPIFFHHALAAVNVGLNIVRSNDAVILDPGGRYTYEEWDPVENPEEWAATKVSYIVPIGAHPNDTLGIPGQHQKFGYRLKNSIQNIWIASLVECRMENLAAAGTLEMNPSTGDGSWELPANGVWTIPSTGVEGVAAHSTDIVFFEGKDIEIPPHMRSTVHTFPMELHIIPQNLHWSPLTPSNNQRMHIKMHVRQFNYREQNANDAYDVNGEGVPTGDAATLDYRDIYQYETNPDGSFKAWKTQIAELAPGVQYVSMVWRDKVNRTGVEEPFKPSYEYDVEKDILLYDDANFVTAAPKFWKMNTRTVYITRINFADHQIEFAPSVLDYMEQAAEGVLF